MKYNNYCYFLNKQMNEFIEFARIYYLLLLLLRV